MRIKRVIVGVLVGTALTLVTAVPAFASAQWCDGDGVVTNPGGTHVNHQSDSLTVTSNGVGHTSNVTPAS